MIDKRLISESRESMRYVQLNVLMQVLSLICNIIATSIFAFILSKMLTGQSIINIEMYLIIGITVIVFRFIFNLFQTRFSHKSSENIKLVLRKKIYDKVVELGTSYQTHVSTAELVQLSVEGIEQLDIYFSRYIPQMFYSLLAPLILFIYISQFSFSSALILFISVPLIPVSIVVVQKIAKRILAKYWSDYTGLGNTFLESIRGLTTLKVFQSDKYQNDKLNVEAERFRKSTMRVLIMQLNSISVMDIVAYGGAGIGIIVGLNNFVNDNVSLFGMILIILLSVEFFLPMRLLGSYFHIAMNGKAASDKIYKLLAIETEGEYQPISNIGDCEIEFDISNFAIEEQQILNQVNISFKKGLNAIVGPSGSGKSTITKLLTKTHLDYTGKITIDNNDLRKISDSDCFKLISIVTHDSYIFSGTIRSNLQIAGNFSDEQMFDALAKVSLLEFAFNHSGLDTVIKAGGSNLSGGQKQRLALARVILLDTPIIIFDEATSNIDIESEMVINQNIQKLSASKTIIIIAHRLHTIKNANQIFVLNHRHVIETGSHQELLRKGGQYKLMFDNQTKLEMFGGYNEN